MRAFINEHQLNQLIAFVQSKFLTYGTQKKEGKVIFDKLVNPSDLLIKTPKATIPFKKILWPNGDSIEKNNLERKIAFIGLTNCDANALKIFLEEFSKFDLVTKRENILVISTECRKDEYCFCTAFGFNKIENFDLHIQTEKDGFSIFSGSKLGEKIIQEIGFTQKIKRPVLREIELPSIERINPKTLALGIDDKKDNIDFWSKIANNCFGCGACTATCPLCFCTRQDFCNKPDGSGQVCLNWDACFSKSFSEVQNHFDFRPTNTDRLYNWYHHKFVRAPEQNGHFLCTGCGRCIKACPAHLNQYRIIYTAYKDAKNE